MRFRRGPFPDEKVLLVSGFGDDTGGGLFALDDKGVEEVDKLSSTGLTLADGRLVRLLRAPLEPGYGSELLVYDERGVCRYLRLDALDDAHDVLWDGSSFVVVSTTGNAILWISPAGEVVGRWQAPGRGDAWHLNSLVDVDGDLLACAFGRFDRHRRWTEAETANAGFVFNVRTGEEVLRGLSCPHHPRLVDGAWFVCNSKDRELVELTEDGTTVRRRLKLRGWTRGIESTPQHLFIGESGAPRRIVATRPCIHRGHFAKALARHRPDRTVLPGGLRPRPRATNRARGCTPGVPDESATDSRAGAA